MHSKLPISREEILATGVIAPEVEHALKSSPTPLQPVYDIRILEDQAAASLPKLQATLNAIRPTNVAEAYHFVVLPDGYRLDLSYASQENQTRTWNVLCLSSSTAEVTAFAARHLNYL
jgi:hypothetical protein